MVLPFQTQNTIIVIIVEQSAVLIGESRVPKKSEYRFLIEGGSSGTVSYRIGEDGVWKTMLPMPKCEVRRRERCGYRRLEPCALKSACTVLRRGVSVMDLFIRLKC